MMFNPMAGKAITRIMDSMPDKPSVIEFGSQTLGFKIGKSPDVKDVRGFYEKLGFVSYEALDLNDEGTQKLDLNKVLEGPQADLVTNNGTGEHIFNQAALFQNAHNFCKAGGVMLHILPWINWQNHGFYNFNPILFQDLANANNYEIIDIFAGTRDGEVLIEKIPSTEIKNPEPTDKNIMLVVAMGKNTNDPFVMPVQGKYADVKPVKTESVWKGVLIGSMGELQTDPFVRTNGVLPDDAYEALSQTYPDKGLIIPDGSDIGDNILHQLQARESLNMDISPVWKSFITYHTSKPFFEELIEWCGPEFFRESSSYDSPAMATTLVAALS
jgi:hypothetical protein